MSADIPYTLDLETLLGPISDALPSGESMRYEGIYDRIREARREDDPRMSRGIYESEPKRADWPAVEALATEALSTRTKDLQLAAWLTEAWTHLYGLAGTREGLRLMAELCARFWETLHPELEGEDCEARVSPVVWVNEKLTVKIKLLAVSSPEAGEIPEGFAGRRGPRAGDAGEVPFERHAHGAKLLRGALRGRRLRARRVRRAR